MPQNQSLKPPGMADATVEHFYLTDVFRGSIVLWLAPSGIVNQQSIRYPPTGLQSAPNHTLYCRLKPSAPLQRHRRAAQETARRSYFPGVV